MHHYNTLPCICICLTYCRYTMYGDENNPGVIYKAAKTIYEHLEETEDREYTLIATFLEIYNVF